MNNLNSPLEPNIVAEFKKRLLARVVVRMEGKVNRDSAEDLRMFDELLAELLNEESIVLSRNERKRLYDELLSSF
jgi:hypothetical protein